MNLENYPGNKGFDKAKYEILNLIPPHSWFFELYAGSAAIAKTVLLSGNKVVINDINKKIAKQLKKDISGKTFIFHINAVYILKVLNIIYWIFKNVFRIYLNIFVYLDPPYPKSSRRSATDIYEFEMTDKQHLKLLKTLLDCRYNCMISSYPNPLYEQHLKHWNKHTFKVMTRGGVAYEVLYFNYPVPEKLNTYKFLGKNCTDRQRINRKVDRTIQKFSSMAAMERNKILSELKKTFS